MKVEVINTGSELLIGQVTNTNLDFLGEQLLDLGLRVDRQTAVPDGQVIKDAIEEAVQRSSVIIITGGLGPTIDDVTRELTAELFNLELKEDHAITEEIRSHIERSGGLMRENNRRQAMVPEGVSVLRNQHGTAPGLYFPDKISRTASHIFLLPGPPRELIPMYHESVRPLLEKISHGCFNEIPVCVNHFFSGLGESELAARINEALGDKNDKYELGFCIKPGGVIVRCVGDAPAIQSVSEIIKAVSPEDYVGEGDISLAFVVVKALMKSKQKVAFAESCTGGLIANTITDVPGSSEVFDVGYVTYSNQAKSDLLGVCDKELHSSGAVSGQVVTAMAEGCLKNSGANHAVAVSGIAGPSGGSKDKPLGTVWIGICSKERSVYLKRYCFKTDRIHFKQRVAQTAIDLLRRRILEFL